MPLRKKKRKIVGTICACGQPTPATNYVKCDDCLQMQIDALYVKLSQLEEPEVTLEEWEKARKSLELMLKELT